MNTNTIILIAIAGAAYLYLRSRREEQATGYSGPPAVITNESSNLAERVSGDVLVSFAKRTINSRNLPRPNSGTGPNAAERMAGG